MIKFQQILSEIKYISEVTPEMVHKLYIFCIYKSQLLDKACDIMYSKGYKLSDYASEWLEK